MDEIMDGIIGDDLGGEDNHEYLIFNVNDIDFGLGIGLVQEIIQMQRIFAIPHAVASCKGIINMRGTIVPVIDMRIKLGFEPMDYNDKTCIIVIEVEGEQIGMIVDSVKDVLRINSEDISSAPTAIDDRKKSGLLSNVAVVNGEVKQILDVYTVFGIDR